MTKKLCSISKCKKYFWTRNSLRTNCLKHEPGLQAKLAYRAEPAFKLVKHAKVEAPKVEGKRKKK